MKVVLDAHEIVAAIMDYVVKRKGQFPKINKNNTASVRLDISENDMEKLTAAIEVEDK